MIKNYFKIAYRTLKKNRVYSLINILGLAIGMTASFFIFIWVQNEFNYDSYHSDAELIYRLTTYDEINKLKSERTSYLLGEELAKQSPEVQMFTRIRPITGKVPTVNIKQEFFKEKNAAYIDDNWFNMFHFDFVQGSSDNFNSQLYSVIISESKAKKYFGHVNILDETIGIDGVDYSIKGVIKDAPPNSSFQYDFYMTVAARHVDPFWKKWDNDMFRDSYRTYVKLSQSASISKFTKQVNAIYSQKDEAPNINLINKIGLIKLKDTHFEDNLESSDLHHGNSKMTNVLFLLGILLLLIACINYVNLTTARASMRIKEVAIRKIVGGERRQLFLQFVIESVLLVLISLVATLILIYLCLPFFNSFVDNHFTLVFISSYLWQTLGLTLFGTAFLTSIYPAFLLSTFRPLSILGGKGFRAVKNGPLRSSLVVVQFTISIILIIATIVIYGQMQFINKQYDNYDKSQVFSFLLPFKESGNEKNQRMESMMQELTSQSSIREIARGTSLINISNHEGPFDWEGHDKDILYNINFLGVGPNFNKVLNLEMKEGRWFLPNSIDDEKNYILNETAVKELGIRQPVIGQRFVHMEDAGVIVGVVKDFHFHGMREKIEPMVFNNNHFYINSFILKSEPGQQMQAREAVERVFKEFFPDEPFDYQFIIDELAQLYRADNKVASMITTFSLLAIFVSCMGLFGLAAFTAEIRNKEIGIRKVLGASVSDIVKMLSMNFIRHILIALLIASPIAWWVMNKWLEDFAYRIEIQWWMFIVAAILSIFIALFTVSFQAIKAAIANPVDSLRDE